MAAVNAMNIPATNTYPMSCHPLRRETISCRLIPAAAPIIMQTAPTMSDVKFASFFGFTRAASFPEIIDLINFIIIDQSF
jgi:hypothetical protein